MPLTLPTSEMLSSFKSTVGGGSAGRQLKGIDACTWDEFTDTCDVSFEASSAMLAKADNPVAKYLHRIFECYQYLTHDSCESNGCQWYDQMCSYTFDDYENLVQSPCLKSANQIVVSVAWSIECADIEDDFQCNVHDHCYWSQEECVFDRWTYYFGIQTIDALPEGFDELFLQRADQLSKYFLKISEEGNSDDAVDAMLYATLPDFNCPFGYEPLVCLYVEAVSQLQQVSFYCNMKYTTASGCSMDPDCQMLVDEGSTLCGASDEQTLSSIYEGEKVFNSAIEDPQARKLEDKRLHCLMQESSYSCTGDCQWSYAGVCLLSGQWVEEYIYSLIGDSDDPVCQYLVLSTTTGCINRDSEYQCGFDDKCFWSPANEYCIAGMNYNVEMALDVSDLGCGYRNISEACQACETERKCKRVPDYDENGEYMSSSHSSDGRAYLMSNGEGQSSESGGSKKSTSNLWLLIIPIGLVLAGFAFAWRYRRNIQAFAADGWTRGTYHPMENTNTY